MRSRNSASSAAERLVHEDRPSAPARWARPSATRCRSPPESPPTGRSSMSAMPRISATLAHAPPDLRAAHPLAAKRIGDVPARTVHMRVEREHLEHEGDVALGGRQATHRPRRRYRPLPRWAGRGPAIIRSVVVLPQPEGPSSMKNSPSSMVKLEESTAVKAPNSLRTFSMRICAITRPPGNG